MGKPGPKPKRIVSETWKPELAYAVGLLASDGCLAKKVHLIDLTSKDREQLKNFCKCIGLDLKIGRKTSGRAGSERNYLRVQFKNVFFYNFLISVGLTPAKSKTLAALKIPPHLFWDFVRGVYDGDGSSYSYWDPRWRSSYMFYTSFVSASRAFVDWMQREIHERTGVTGSVSTAGRGAAFFQLKYAKADSLVILRKMYRAGSDIHLSRKRLKVEKILGTVGEKL